MSYGFILGYGQTDISGTSFIGFEPQFRPKFGVNFEFDFSNKGNLFLVLEPAFQRKSINNEGRITDESGNFLGTSNYSINLDYISVPVRMRYRKGDNWQFIIDAGLYLSYLIDQKDILEGHEFLIDGRNQRTLEFDNKDRYKNTDFGISAGIGMGRKVSNELHMTLGLQTDLGLPNIQSPNANWGPGEIQTNTINLVLGLNFSKKK